MQITKYRGADPRAWMSAGLRDANRRTEEYAWLVDTGSPMDLCLSDILFDRYILWNTRPRKTNYGWLDTGVFHWMLPGISQPLVVRGFRANRMSAIASKSDPSFVGVVGLPILRRGRFGGDANEFWFDYS